MKSKRWKKKMMPKIIKALVLAGASPAYIERALELEFGSLKKWANGKFRNEDFALISIIASYPWLLEVADEQFRPMFAAGRMLIAADQVEQLVTRKPPHQAGGLK